MRPAGVEKRRAIAQPALPPPPWRGRYNQKNRRRQHGRWPGTPPTKMTAPAPPNGTPPAFSQTPVFAHLKVRQNSPLHGRVRIRRWSMQISEIFQTVYSPTSLDE